MKKVVKKKSQLPLKFKEVKPVCITIQIPTNGIQLKVLNGLGSVKGTFLLTNAGLKFLGPNKKKWSTSNVFKWESFEKILRWWEDFVSSKGES